MSVIFDALNKLDKEKRSPKTGMLIVGAGSIAGRRGGIGAPLLGAASIGLVLLGAAAWWWVNGGPETPPASPTASAKRAPALPVPASAPPASPPASSILLPADLAVVPAAAPGEGAEAAQQPVPPSIGDTEPARPGGPVPLRLEAITTRDDGPVAIVNGRIVREGDVFDGILVVRIGEAEVELVVQAEERTLLLRF